MRWLRVSATDPFARVLADRHYPRENAGSKFFSPPGAKVVLRTLCARAFWVSLFQLPEFTDHQWPGAWQCSAFRNESAHRSSELIREAIAATVAEWGDAPQEGMITFVDAVATRRRRSRHHMPGHCFRVAGFCDTAARTTRGFHVLRLAPSAAGCLRHEGFRYALDNGAWSAFAQRRPFSVSDFERALAKMGAGADWVVLPDIVAGGLASLELSLRWMRRVLDSTERGLVAVQNGIVESDVEGLLGPRVGLFVGGSTEWKLETLPRWCALGARVGCWVHVGRVNTARRIHLCGVAGATSFDGTSASRFSKTVPRLETARRQLALGGLLA